jgi:hypothetical protein
VSEFTNKVQDELKLAHAQFGKLRDPNARKALHHLHEAISWLVHELELQEERAKLTALISER